MVRKSKKQDRKRKRRASEQSTKSVVGPASGGGWGFAQIGIENYFFLMICVVAQLATILITWPTWQVRALPPNLPWLESTPQFSCGILLIATLVVTLISPRRFGLAIHLTVMAIAIVMDQFRCQPQILSVALMMAACVWAPARRVCVWFLVSMWLWAGIHKFLSADWFMQVSYNLLSDTGINAMNFHVGFAAIVAFSEVLLGLAAWRGPKMAVVGCLLLHVGIVIFLLFIGWNVSVLPWNICMALVGAWLLWNAETVEPGPEPSRLSFPGSSYEIVAVVAMLIVPIGMYFGLIRHCFAHALYSGNLPIGLVTHQDEIEPLEAWDTLRFPFPNEHKAYCDYFELTGVAGDKLHIRDPRPGFTSRYLRFESTGRLKEISVDDFFSNSDGGVEGVSIDDPQKIYLLEKGYATMLKRSEKEMIYAVEFDPGGFDVKLLEHLHGLPNLEQIQLADCNVTDEDLKQLLGFQKLMGIGLDDTAITDAGLKHLKDLPRLEVLEYRGTAITAAGLQAEGLQALIVPQ